MPLLLVNSLLATPEVAVSGNASITMPLMPPCGINTAPEWALDRAGLPREDGPAYTYPDTQVPVRLYLIDTSVANPGDWIGANPKLTLERTELIRGINDPQTFSTDHGTKMLSLIGDPKTGIAPGTPIHVVNYDVFPTAQTTDLTLLANAIYEAILDARAKPSMRSVICIATSTTQKTSDFILQLAIEDAVAEGIPVIVSAGNLGEEIPISGDSYIPAAYGVQDGVICVGASGAADARITISNFGAPVDLLAPGEAVRVRTDSLTTPFAAMTGTSPSTALVAGAVLTELSLNSSLTPAQVEEHLKASAIIPPTQPDSKVLRATVAVTAAVDAAEGIIISPGFPLPLGYDPSFFENFTGSLNEDSNHNGVPDILDILLYYNGPYSPASPTVSPTSGPDAKYRFPIDPDLFDDSNPFILKNNFRWRIQCSGDMKTWQVPEGSIAKSVDEDGRVWLTATFPAPPTACFVRLQVVDPGPAVE